MLKINMMPKKETFFQKAKKKVGILPSEAQKRKEWEEKRKPSTRVEPSEVLEQKTSKTQRVKSGPTMKMNLSPETDINKKIRKDIEEEKPNKTKKGGKEASPKTPKEEVEDFIIEFNLSPLLPEEFNNLNESQKLKVVQDLKRRIVDIVKSDAQTQYSEDVKTKGLGGKLVSSLTKKSDVENQEKTIFYELKRSQEGQELLRHDLEILTKKTQKMDIYISTTGKACVDYLDIKTISEIGEETFNVFTVKANTFASMPYEWGQEKKNFSKFNPEIFKSHRGKYEKAKAEYEKAREEILKIKSEKERPEEKGKAMLEILEIENIIKMEQLLNTHPEFEKVLDDMEKDPGFPSFIKTVFEPLGTVTNTLTGKNLMNRALIAGGFGARMAAKGAALFTGVGVLTYLGGTAVGGIVGGLRGRIRGKETLQERQKQARHGQKDESKEKVVTTDSIHLTKRLEDLLIEIDNATTDEERAKKLSMLATRIEHTQGKIEKGQVNFGDTKSSLVNQFNLVNNLNRALVLKETNSENTNRELKERMDRLLTIQGKNIAEKTSETQRKFIKKQMWKGAALGAGLATVGYTLRYVGEHFGWWESLGKHTPWHHNETNGGVKPATSQAPQNTPRQIPEKPVAPSATQQPPALTNQPSVPKVGNFANEGIKFKHGKGGIQGILDLKKQIAEQYNGDYSKAPESVQDFVKTDALEEAKKLGLYDPNNPNESALIQEGSTLKFDEKGGLIFHDAKTGEDFTHYKGKMFDSDGSAKVLTTEIKTEIPIEHANAETPTPEQPDHTLTTTPKSEIPPVEPAHTPAPEPTPITKPVTPEALTETIKTQIDAEAVKTSMADSIINRPGPGYQTVHAGTRYQTGQTFETGTVHDTGITHNTGRVVGTGGGNIYLNDPFSDISHENNLLLKQNPAFAENPFNLSGGKLMEVYETINKDLGYVFKDVPETWSKLPSTLKERADEILIYQEHPSDDPIANKLSSYLNILKNHADLKPKGGFLGMGAENSEHFIARCLQKLSKTGELEIFEKNLRNLN